MVAIDAHARSGHAGVAARLHAALDQLCGTQHAAERHARHRACGQRVKRFAVARRRPRAAAAVGQLPPRRVVHRVVDRRLKCATHQRRGHATVETAYLRRRGARRSTRQPASEAGV